MYGNPTHHSRDGRSQEHLSLRCPLWNNDNSLLRFHAAKLVLIDEAWVSAPDKDYRLFFFADVRVDDIRENAFREEPLEQFIDAFFCGRCSKAFVSEQVLRPMDDNRA